MRRLKHIAFALILTITFSSVAPVTAWANTSETIIEETAASEEQSNTLAETLASTEGFVQVKSVGKNSAGLCTSCATAYMMKRKQIVDGKEPTFDFFDVRMSFGLSREQAVGLRYANANWDQEKGFSNFYSGDGSTTFYTTSIRKNELGSTVAERKAAIIALLDEHPEGIVIYSDTKYNAHAICLTSYDAETDTFYGVDSVDVRDAATAEEGRVPEKLSGTYLFENCGGSIDSVFKKLTDTATAGCVWYVSDVVYPE